MSLEDFVKKEDGGKDLLVNVTVPFTAVGTHFKTFKTAARHENSHAFVNAALSTVVAEDKTITSAR
jgi:hypothetical protein